MTYRPPPRCTDPAAQKHTAAHHRSPSEQAYATLGNDDCWHIDIRNLPPPAPLVDILRHVDGQGHDGHTLIVHHNRDPVLLYAELAQRGWVADAIDAEPGEVCLCLRPEVP